jgi:6-pyruvoyltetrahydropterin/6-carboxytetrahydropterin synthase
MPSNFSIQVAKDYFSFASAHFLTFADGTRELLHGHNYQVSVRLDGDLDGAGMVVNFITFKPLVKQICDALDHRTLIQKLSPQLKIRRAGPNIEIIHKRHRFVIPRQDVLLLPLANTSTEMLAQYIAGQIRKGMQRQFPGVKLYSIEVGVEEAKGQKGIFTLEL